FEAYRVLYTILRDVGAAYVLYLACKIATAGPTSNEPEGSGKPVRYWGAAEVQGVNPKDWEMAVSGISPYTPWQGYFTKLVST
ncbi:LysE family translocator, partial [Pseudomonas aeruginosa]